MDKATDYLLLQEAKLSRLISSMKLILPNIKTAALKNNARSMKMIAKRLPQKNIKAIERDAIRQIPGFKQDYAEAKRKLSRSKTLGKYTAKPAAIAIALVSSSTKNSVGDVLKKGEMGVRNSKMIPIPSYFPLIKLVLFVTFVTAMIMTDGAVLVPTVALILKSTSMMFALLANILKGAASGLTGNPDAGSDKGIIGKMFDRPPTDPSVTANIKRMGAGHTPNVSPPPAAIPNEIIPAHNLDAAEDFLSTIDPLGIN